MGLKDPEYYINILISKSGNDIFFVIIIVKYYFFKYCNFKGTSCKWQRQKVEEVCC